MQLRKVLPEKGQFKPQGMLLHNGRAICDVSGFNPQLHPAEFATSLPSPTASLMNIDSTSCQDFRGCFTK